MRCDVYQCVSLINLDQSSIMPCMLKTSGIPRSRVVRVVLITFPPTGRLTCNRRVSLQRILYSKEKSTSDKLFIVFICSTTFAPATACACCTLVKLHGALKSPINVEGGLRSERARRSASKDPLLPFCCPYTLLY